MVWWQRIIESSPYVILVLAFVMLRILQVFTKHQQKMAEILNRTASDHNELASLRHEVSELKSLLQNQIPARDNLRDLPPVPPVPEQVKATS